VKGIISKLFGLLAVVAITVTAMAYVFDGTLLSAKYLNQAANRSELYDNLAAHLPDALAAGNPNPEVIKTALGLFLTADFIQQQLTPWFDELEAYYKHNGPPPQLQLTDFAEQAAQYEIAIPTGAPFDAPLVWQDPGIMPIAQRMVMIKTFGPFAALLLLIMAGLVFHGFHRYTTMAKVLVVAAFVQGLLALVLQSAPGLVASPLSNQRQLQVVAPDIAKFLKLVGSDMATSLGQIAIGLVIAAVVLLLFGLILKVTSRVGHKKESTFKSGPDTKIGSH
jgi:hypothetical protein